MSFDEYIVKYNKIYQNELEKGRRQIIYKKNVKKLQKSRCPACGVNKFTDFSEEEISNLKGVKSHYQMQENQDKTKNEPNTEKLTPALSYQSTNSDKSTEIRSLVAPKYFDWRDYGVITSVKNQLKCGACWAFSTTAFFQSELIRRAQAKSTIDLSEQYLFQCDLSSSKCQGGNLYSPMDLVLSKGIPFEISYPYNPNFAYPGICRVARGPNFPFSFRATIYNLTDSQIIQYLLQRPLNIGIKSDQWEKYAPNQKERVFQCKEIKNGIKEFNHAVLLVGYSETEWIVKNQWGPDWGVDGYMYISRNPKYNCGIGLEINTLNYRLKDIRIQQP